MEKKKKMDTPIYIPLTPEEGKTVLDRALQESLISFPRYEDTIPESVFANCKSRLDIVIAAKEYLSNRCVTDEEFYDLISKDPAYLGDNFAQDKIRQWQGEVNSEDKDKASDAQEKLKRIAQALARKKGMFFRMFKIAEKRHDVYLKLKNARMHDKKQDTNRRLRLKELFGDSVLDGINKLPRRNDELADIITAKLMNTTAPIVEKCRKKQVHKIPDYPIYVIRK